MPACPSVARQAAQAQLPLARAEVDSAYQPARKLWARTRNGHYLPNPALQLRQGDGWQPVYEVLKLEWVDRGTGTDRAFSNRPALAVTRMRERLAGKAEEFF